jgi:predicted permease
MPVVLNMALGTYLTHIGTLDKSSIKTINDLCFGIFLPVIIFKNIYDIDFRSEFHTRLMLFAILAVILMLVLLLVILRFFIKERAFYLTCVHVTGRPNYIMFGLSLMSNMFGDEGVRIASMLTPVAVIPFNFLGVILISLALSDPGLSMPKLLKDTTVNCFKNPIIIASVAGLVISMSGLRLPVFLDNLILPLSRVGNPLALLLLGAQMDLQSLKDSAFSVAAISAAKLILLPVVMLSIAVAVGFRGVELAVLLIYFGAPIGSACAILAQHYNVYAKFTVQAVTITSMLSGFTMFLWISVMRFFQLF